MCRTLSTSNDTTQDARLPQAAAALPFSRCCLTAASACRDSDTSKIMSAQHKHELSCSCIVGEHSCCCCCCYPSFCMKHRPLLSVAHWQLCKQPSHAVDAGTTHCTCRPRCRHARMHAELLPADCVSAQEGFRRGSESRASFLLPLRPLPADVKLHTLCKVRGVAAAPAAADPFVLLVLPAAATAAAVCDIACTTWQLASATCAFLVAVSTPGSWCCKPWQLLLCQSISHMSAC